MIYQHGVSKSVAVKAVDNGWIVEWENKRNRDIDDEIGIRFGRKELPTCGTEIFTDRKKMLKFLESHI